MIKIKGAVVTLTVFFIWLMPAVSFGRGRVDTAGFYEGNAFYGEKQYDKAIQQYQQILEQGYVSGNIYYNLGNCYYKKGDYPRALLYYERAKRLIPHDADLASNYQFVSSLVKSSYRKPQQKYYSLLLKKVFGSFGVNELLVIFTMINILIFLILILRLFFAALRRYSMYLVVILCVILSMEFYYSLTEISAIGKEAIIVAPTVAVRFEPRSDATTYFTLWGGDKIIVIENGDKWEKIKRGDGKTGWIPKTAEEKI